MELKDVKTDEFTISSGHIEAGNDHQVYYEQWGNKKAETPILVFHGGPGSGYKPHNKYYFDPKVHQVIIFDQRGTGNSLPYGELAHNTTQDLIDDAVAILKKLKVKKAYVFGCSWGSTLALLFSILHKDLVKAVIAQAIFTGSKKEIDHFDKGVFSKYYPEVWDRLVKSVPNKHQDNPVKYHYEILTGKNKNMMISSSKALEEMERPVLKFDWAGYQDIKPDKDPNSVEPEYDYVPYQIYAHYFSNGCFLDDEYILNNARHITSPLYMVHGRYDMGCPPETAVKLHKEVKNSKLYITLASHGKDPETRTALKVLIDTVFV